MYIYIYILFIWYVYVCIYTIYMYIYIIDLFLIPCSQLCSLNPSHPCTWQHDDGKVTRDTCRKIIAFDHHWGNGLSHQSSPSPSALLEVWMSVEGVFGMQIRPSWISWTNKWQTYIRSHSGAQEWWFVFVPCLFLVMQIKSILQMLCDRLVIIFILTYSPTGSEACEAVDWIFTHGLPTNISLLSWPLGPRTVIHIESLGDMIYFI